MSPSSARTPGGLLSDAATNVVEAPLACADVHGRDKPGHDNSWLQTLSKRHPRAKSRGSTSAQDEALAVRAGVDRQDAADGDGDNRWQPDATIAVTALRHHAPMALNATVYTFDIELADADRHVYESLNLRVACHPSEAQDFLATRVLAYCREYAPGIGFSPGLSTPDEPAIHVRDPTGLLLAWIDIGVPDAARVHRASKAAARVAVYTHKPAEQLRRALAGERIHRSDALELIEVDRGLLAEWTPLLQRRMKLSLSFSGGDVYLALGERTLTGTLRPITLDDGLPP
jgi:uncharacterized protein YaeQ